jgi:hypothetical protein
MEENMKRFFVALFGLLMLCSQAFAGGFNGIWWNKSESGWGINFSQQAEVIFASMFVYRATGQPVWYVATMRSTAAVPGTFSGDLYETTGPYFGAASFNPGNVTARRAGTMGFTSSSGINGTLSYNVDGVVVTKVIEPQPLATIALASTYAVTLIGAPQNNCPMSQNLAGASRVLLSGNSFQLQNAAGQAICSATGAYTQAGDRYVFLANNPSCLVGSGIFTVIDLKGEGIAAVINTVAFLTGVISIQNSAQTCSNTHLMAGVNLN